MKQLYDDILRQHVAVVGKTGSGKTSTAKLLIEYVQSQGARVCILDPIKSDWWGLTSSADGKRPGLPFYILGGPRGHVPLHAKAGAAIGDLVGTGQLPLSILDMADFEMGGLQQFFTQFAPALLKRLNGVLYLVVEESHEFAPKERAGFGSENMSIHFAKRLATAGRSRGVRLIVATQRTQALHNAVLGSCDTIVAHRLISPADKEPVVKWLKANLPAEKAKEVEASLSSLKTGEAWVCSGELGYFERHQFPRISTFDNTATPDGKANQLDVKTAHVDQERLRAIIGKAADEAKANDPQTLKAEITRLRRELEMKPVAPLLAQKPAEVRVVSDEDRAAIQRMQDQLNLISGGIGKANAAIHELRSMAERLMDSLRGYRRPGDLTAPITPAFPHFKARVQSIMEPGGELPKGERAVLTACAQFEGGVAREELTVLTGYKRSSRDAYIQRLREKGFVYENGARICATEEGIQGLGDFTPLPTGDALREHWMPRLPEGERKVLEFLVANHPNSVDRSAIDGATGYQRSSRDAYLQRLSAKRLVVLSRGQVQASDALFG